MGIIKFDEIDLELVKTYFLYVVIVVLTYSNIHVFNLYVTLQEERNKDNKEQLKIYEEGYFRTNEILQNYIKYETIKVYDTVKSTTSSIKESK